jgi:glutamate-ammonia-ligase adenylyltransferase
MAKDATANLESLAAARSYLEAARLRDLPPAYQNLRQLLERLGPTAMARLMPPLARYLPRCPDPDQALTQLERFLATDAGAAQLDSLLDGRARRLEIILGLFSSSQHFSELLVANPNDTEMMWVPLRRSPSRDELLGQLHNDVGAVYEDSAVRRALRRYRERQHLRIGTNDLIRDRPLAEITSDISVVADVAVEVALSAALKHLGGRFGLPIENSGEPATCVILAFGKLGGEELNYSSDIDLMVAYSDEGTTNGRLSVSNDEFFGRVTTEVVRLLSTHPQAYRVDLRLRPEGARGPLARSLASTLGYYDTLGRTWERQALIKLRPIAGDKALGERLLEALEPFIYRRYLSFAEINEIKVLKRKIERKTKLAGETSVDVKTGHGGIRDVEFTIQFLQLLNGGDLPAVRQRGTLHAIEMLEEAGCLTDQESRILSSTYAFLRKVEHRLQLMFDLQTHRLPEREDELDKLAQRMGYRPPPDAASQDFQPNSALRFFLKDYREKADLNRHILNHLLHESFEGAEGQADPEADLILEPDPEPERIRQVLERYRFKDPQAAYRNLMLLTQESVPFLSTRRCRQFLASIAPGLLRGLADTPDPDLALVNLEKVTASLGAKGVLWELFSFNEPSLRLYVDLCAWSSFLSQILISNPGMIDELLDTLVLNQPRTLAQLRTELADLCRNAEAPDMILHSFRDRELLRIGVNDILGKDTLEATLTSLSHLAEAMLGQVADIAFAVTGRRHGSPAIGDPGATGFGQPGAYGLGEPGALATGACRYAILALGKLGGEEMSYNSDLDIVLVYEADGRTEPRMLEAAAPTRHGPRTSAGESPAAHSPAATTNFHFFSDFAQRIIKMMSQLGPQGRLYEVDMRLRPTGRSGSLVVPLAEFKRYYAAGSAQLWERQALTRARVVHGDAGFAAKVMAAVHEACYAAPWRPEFADEIARMRERLEESRSERDLKRGFGGIVDIEFLVQLYQLKHGQNYPVICRQNARSALRMILAEQLMPAEAEDVLANYDFLRRVESRLRIVHNVSQDELPANPDDVEKLARRLDIEPDASGTARAPFLREMEQRTARTRELFTQLVARERG